MMKRVTINSLCNVSSRLFTNSAAYIQTHTRKHLELQKKLLQELNKPARIVKLPKNSLIVTAPHIQKEHHLNTSPGWTPDILSNFSESEIQRLYMLIKDKSPRIAKCSTMGPINCVESVSEMGVAKYYIDPKYLAVNEYIALRDILSPELLESLSSMESDIDDLNNGPKV